MKVHIFYTLESDRIKLISKLCSTNIFSSDKDKLARRLNGLWLLKFDEVCCQKSRKGSEETCFQSREAAFDDAEVHSIYILPGYSMAIDTAL
jgi:hypothetical protein